MSVIKPSSVLGYVEYTDLAPNPEVGAILGYIEYIGTPEKIALSEDAQVNTVIGYIEWTATDPNPKLGSVIGYVEYQYCDPTPSPQAVLGYVEYIGTPEKIALSKDAQVNTTLAYIEYIWDGKTPPITVVGFGPAIWMI